MLQAFARGLAKACCSSGRNVPIHLPKHIHTHTLFALQSGFCRRCCEDVARLQLKCSLWPDAQLQQHAGHSPHRTVLRVGPAQMTGASLLSQPGRALPGQSGAPVVVQQTAALYRKHVDAWQGKEASSSCLQGKSGLLTRKATEPFVPGARSVPPQTRPGGQNSPPEQRPTPGFSAIITLHAGSPRNLWASQLGQSSI